MELFLDVVAVSLVEVAALLLIRMWTSDILTNGRK